MEDKPTPGFHNEDDHYLLMSLSVLKEDVLVEDILCGRCLAQLATYQYRVRLKHALEESKQELQGRLGMDLSQEEYERFTCC